MRNDGLRVGVVGATGMVGQEFLKILEQRRFKLSELRPFASERSEGQSVAFQEKTWTLQSLKPNCFEGLDLVFFSSGDEISRQWASEAVSSKAYAIDNSAAFRLDAEVPLVVPEVNGATLSSLTEPCIIANPNCSTIQLVVALNPLRHDFGLESVQVASYQAVSGAGVAGQSELLNQSQAWLKGETQPSPGPTFSHPIAFNCIPHIGSFNQDGYSSEEMKIIRETKKILDLPHLSVSAFTVRVPALNGHSEAVWVTLQKPADRNQIVESLRAQEGLEILDDLNQNLFPTAVQASGTDPVYVGRIHRDLDRPERWLMWVVADNLRKGAALNGVQIAERLFT